MNTHTSRLVLFLAFLCPLGALLSGCQAVPAPADEVLVRGQVVDSESGEGLAGVDLSFAPDEHPGRKHLGETDTGGFYALSVEAGASAPGTLLFEKEGYGQRAFRVPSDSPVQLRLGTQETAPKVVKLGRD